MIKLLLRSIWFRKREDSLMFCLLFLESYKLVFGEHDARGHGKLNKATRGNTLLAENSNE